MPRLNLPLPEVRLLTSTEAAEYCGISVGSLKAHIRVAPLKIGRSIRYDRVAIDKYLDEISGIIPGAELQNNHQYWLDKLKDEHIEL